MGARLVLLMLAGLASSPAFAAPEADAAAALRVTRYLAELSSLRAQFQQSVADARGRVIERAEGTMAIARPGRFRWDYRTPEQLIVCDGVTVWLYDIELDQVTVKAAGDALAGTPAMLLAGHGSLEQEFTIADAGRDSDLAWSLLTPHRADADFREVRLGFDGRDLRRMRLFDRLGQTTELEFTSIEHNPKLEQSLFSFDPPPGVDVVGRAPAG